ncbi:MAG: hypothetical protein QNJ60_01505 [Xenococcaceae cyanobacterium MO_188.B19]|nr:hypothetical protein [Xenococcaceae cyanobacterium MO_188.B19]
MLKFSNNVASNFRLILFSILLLIGGCSSEKESNQTSVSTPAPLARRSTKITASPAVTERPLSKNYACFNVNSLLVKSWSNPDFSASVNQVNPTLLRIPGGTESNYWDWQKGGLIKNVREAMAGYPINFRSKDLKYNDSKLKDIIEGIQATDTVPLFVLNLASSTLESQLEMLRTANDLGMPVEYIELGNEFYIDVPNYRRVFASSEDYAKTASQWSKAIKAEFPQANITLVGAISKSKSPKRVKNWNSNLISSAIADADGITLHVYSGHGLKSPIDLNSNYPFFTEEEVPIILGQPFRSAEKFYNSDDFKLIPNDKQIWITEYNLFENIFGNNEGKAQRVMGSWTHGLYTLTQSLLFLEDSRINIACNHVLVGNSRFAAIFRGAASFVNPSDPNIKVTPNNLTATGSTLSFLGEAISGMTKAQKIDFSFSPTLIGKKDFEYPALYGWKFSDGEYSKGIIVNLSNQNIPIDLEQLFSVSVSYEQLTENPRTLVTGTDVLQFNSGEATSEIVLPPYSVTKLRETSSLLFD